MFISLSHSGCLSLSVQSKCGTEVLSYESIRASKSVAQRLEDYWLGLRVQNMDIPVIQVVKSSDSAVDDGLL